MKRKPTSNIVQASQLLEFYTTAVDSKLGGG